MAWLSRFGEALGENWGGLGLLRDPRVVHHDTMVVKQDISIRIVSNSLWPMTWMINDDNTNSLWMSMAYDLDDK